jgi:hypothetical protein
LAALVTAAMAPAAVGVAGAAPKDAFRPGLYVGKTSQGEPVRLKVRGCGSSECLESPDQFDMDVQMQCGSESEPSEEAVYLSGATIPASGKVKVNLSGFATVLVTYQVGHGGVITGTLRATRTLPDGTKCDSGNVTLKAGIGGSGRS